MTCADLEILLCDYVDGTLPPAQRAAVEAHLAGCSACAELGRDAAAGAAFLERVAEVDPPAELLTRMLFEPPWTRARLARFTGLRRWWSQLLRPILQPRLAMGMAMTILSLAVLARFGAPMRPLQPEDLKPANVWAALDDRAYRTWQRAVKFYDSLKFVYQLRSSLREWQEQQEEEKRLAPPEQDTSGRGDERRLAPKTAPAR